MALLFLFRRHWQPQSHDRQVAKKLRSFPPLIPLNLAPTARLLKAILENKKFS